jgi:hypothetical protein
MIILGRKMKITKAILATGIFLIIMTSTFAQTKEQKVVAVESQKAIIDKLANEIRERYLFKNVGQSLFDTLKVYKGKIKETVSVSDFSEKITSILRIKSNDSHLMFYYDSLKFESYLLDEREKRKLEFEREKNINFGFTKVEILEANLGYIQMVKFSDFSDDVAKKKIASIMNFVQHTNALIIDLRFNSGGQGETIDLFSSYFLSNKGTTINNSDQYISKPIYILTSNGTFSAAEKFTSLLQESKRAIVIGEKTIGGGHSGRSVSILDGFLAFIPTGGENDPLENIGVTPDYPIKESETLIYAKYLYFKSLKSETNSEEYAKTLWYMENCKYLMKIDNDEVDIFKSEFVGEYEGNRTIILKDNKPFLSTKNNSYPLVQINMQEFIIDGDDYFGKGNSRISFNTDKSKPGIEHRVFVNDKINSKYFNKK